MIRVGLIGCGSIAKKHIETMAKLPNVELVAVSDLKYEQMQTKVDLYRKITQKVTKIALYKDYTNLIIDPRIDVVVIATISGLHARMAKHALIGLKHVIVEKPLALSLQDITKMEALAEKYHKRLFVCHQLRYRPLMTEIKQLIEHNYLGEVYYGVISLRLNRSAEYYNESKWRGTWNLDGGMLVNQGIHLVDLLIWFLGDVQSVYGELMHKLLIKETEDIALGVVTFSNGTKALIEANTITKPENVGYYLSLFGEKGTLIIGGKRFDEVDHCYIENFPTITNQLKKIETDRLEHELMYKDFIRAIEDPHYQPILTAKDGRSALEVIFSLYQSAQTNELIHLPLEHYRTTQGRERSND